MDILNKRMSKITLTTLEVSSFGWHRIKGVPRWIFYDVFGRRDEKISTQPHTSLCIHNLLVIHWIIKPHIWMHNEVWGCAEIFPKRKVTCGGRSHPTVDTLHWWAHLKRWSALIHSGIIWLGLQRKRHVFLDYAKDLYRVEQFENKYRKWLGKLYKAVQKMSLRCTDCQHLWHHAECLDIINYSWVLKRDNLNAIDRKMKKYRIFFTRVVHELLLLQIPVMDKPFLNFMIIIVTFHWEHFKLSVYRAKI